MYERKRIINLECLFVKPLRRFSRGNINPVATTIYPKGKNASLLPAEESADDQ
jgi:hypothetical protein